MLGSVEHVLDDPDPRSLRVDSEALAAAQPVRRMLALRRERLVSRSHAGSRPSLAVRLQLEAESLDARVSLRLSRALAPFGSLSAPARLRLRGVWLRGRARGRLRLRSQLSIGAAHCARPWARSGTRSSTHA